MKKVETREDGTETWIEGPQSIVLRRYSKNEGREILWTFALFQPANANVSFKCEAARTEANAPVTIDCNVTPDDKALDAIRSRLALRALDALTDDQRAEVLSQYCRYCGRRECGCR